VAKESRYDRNCGNGERQQRTCSNKHRKWQDASSWSTMITLLSKNYVQTFDHAQNLSKPKIMQSNEKESKSNGNNAELVELEKEKVAALKSIGE